MSPTLRAVSAVALLIASNAFMTYAWYFHVGKKSWGLLAAIIISWLIAFPEYLLQVPANRLGHTNFGGPLSLPQLKILQEGITLSVFLIFTVMVAKEKPRSTDLVAMGLILVAVIVAMLGRNGAPTTSGH